MQVKRIAIPRGTHLLLATAMAVVCNVPSASAQSKQLARHFAAGVDAYRLGDYDEARVQLEKARALDPSLPGPHRFLAAVAKAQERFAECVTHAATALRVAPQSREADDTRKLHEACRVADGRSPFRGTFGEGGALAVTARQGGESAFVQVTIDGKAVGSTPLFPRAVPAGSHSVSVGGQDPLRVEVLPGVVTDVAVDLTAQGWLELPESLASAAGLFVEIDGVKVAAAVRIPVAEGRRAVRVGKPGAKPWTTTIDVAAGKTIALRPVLVRAKPKKPPKR